MRAFRIILWLAVLAIVIILGLTSFHWQNKITKADSAYGTPFQLVDQTGQPITESDIRAKPTAIFFGFTHCPEICPTTLYELDGWLDEADPSGEKINAYFVTVDPERDTADVLNLYISNVTNRISGITGDKDKVFDMLKGYNVYFKKVPYDDKDPSLGYNMDHTASVFLLKKGGLFKGTIAYGENPETAVQKLKNLL